MNNLRTYLLAALVGLLFTLPTQSVFADYDYDEPPEPPPFEEDGDIVEVCVDGSCNLEFDVEGGDATIRRSANNDFDSEIDIGNGFKNFSPSGGDVDNDFEIDIGDGYKSFSPSSTVFGSGNSRAGGGDADVLVDVEISNEAADVRGAAKEAARRAAQAARVSASSNGGITPCGDTTGLSVSTGIAGGALGTITEACRAFRATQAEALVSTKKAFAVKFQYWVGFIPRTVLHVCTLGVLN